MKGGLPGEWRYAKSFTGAIGNLAPVDMADCAIDEMLAGEICMMANRAASPTARSGDKVFPNSRSAVHRTLKCHGLNDDFRVAVISMLRCRS